MNTLSRSAGTNRTPAVRQDSTIASRCPHGPRIVALFGAGDDAAGTGIEGPQERIGHEDSRAARRLAVAER